MIGTDGWEVRTVGSLGSVRGGKRLPKGRSLTVLPTPHPYVRVTDMRQGGVDTSDLRFVPEDVAPSIRAYRIFKDDIFISVAGTLGIVGRIPAEIDGANLTENADRITSITCDVDYLMYSLLGESIQNEIDSIRTVGAQPKLALGRIKQFEIPIPKARAEQKRIAQVFRDADDLIATLERLIAKKQAIKQGLLQQLVTGRVRLPGFDEPWQTQMTITDLTQRFSGYWGAVPGELEVDARIIRAGDVTAQHEVASFAQRSLTRTQHSRSACRPGDVVLTTSGTIGNVALIRTKGLTASNFIRVLRPQRRILGGFLYYALQATPARTAMAVHLGVSAMPNLGSGFFTEPFLSIPSVTEQQAIVRALEDADMDIVLLRARLQKARAIKSAMMQQLLTGRVRLPEGAAS